MSLQPGGSTEQTARWRRSARELSARSASLTDQGSGGTQACTAEVKGLVLMSFSISSTCSAFGVGAGGAGGLTPGECGGCRGVGNHGECRLPAACTSVAWHPCLLARCGHALQPRRRRATGGLCNTSHALPADAAASLPRVGSPRNIHAWWLNGLL